MDVVIKKTSDQEYSFLNSLVMGESGSGKTHYLGTADNKRTLIINVKSESGIFTLRDKELDVTDVDNFEEIMAVFEWLKTAKHDYLYIGIDSLSQLQKNFEKQSANQYSDKFKMWSAIKENTKTIVDTAKRLPFHLCFVCEVKVEKDEESGSIKVLPSLVGSAKDEIQYYFDEVFYFDKAQVKDGSPITYRCLTSSASKYPCKDRSGKLPLIIENPNWTSISEVIFGKVTKEKQKEKLDKVRKADADGKPTKEELDKLDDLKQNKVYDASAFFKRYGLPNGMTKEQVLEAIAVLEQKPDGCYANTTGGVQA